MPDPTAVSRPVVLVLGACQPPGAAIARVLAKNDMRSIVVDGDAPALTRIAAPFPNHIETLTIEDIPADLAHHLGAVWGAAPLHMVVNLMPLANPAQITRQMRGLSAILRATARGLVAGKGSIVNLVARPADPLSLVGHGMQAAVREGTTVLARALKTNGVRAHVLSVPAHTPEVAVPTVLHLARRPGRDIDSASLDLG